MKNILRKIFLLTSVGWMCGLPSWSQTTKIEAESFIDSKSGSTDIKIENDRSVGYFDEYGEQLIYEINVETTGMYKMTFKYVSQTDGKIRISMDDGSYFVYNLTAYRLLGDNWWQLPFSDWYEFPIDNGPSFYLTQGKHIMTVTNEEAVFNLDCFMMQKSSVTDNEVAQVKTTPSKVVLMQGEYGDVYPRAYNKSGEMIAAPVTWSSNVKDGRYTAGSYGTDEIVLTMGSISKTIKVDIAKPTKKKEFVVSKYGSLRTDKGYVADASGNKVCLMGPSLFWSCSAPLWWNKETVNFLVEKYNIQVIRLPVAIAPCGSSGQTSCGNPPDTWNKDCYYYRPDYTKKLVDEVVKAAIENDIYVVIDFHEHKAEDWTNLAKEFFTYFATKWGEFPNVMYEIYNEPLYEVDNSIVISYAKQVIPVIRAIDKDNIIIVGSKRFSREPDQVTSAGDGYSNIAYTWHGYVKYDHQGDWSNNTWNNGVPVIVTEWGLNGGKADGGLLNTFKQRGVINCFWSMCNLGGDDAIWSVLKDNCYKVSDWSNNDMTENGAFLLETTKGWINFKPVILDDSEEFSMSICSSQKVFLPVDAVNLSGSAKGGTEKYTYTWKQVSGPSQVDFSSPNSEKTTVSGIVAGSYSFMLVISDGEDELSETTSLIVYPEGYVDPGLIDNIDDNDIISRWGGSWDVFDDSNKNANPHSTVTSASQLPSDGRIKADIKMGNQWQGEGWMGDPYCGVELYLNEEKTAMDLSECSRITYRFRGSSHEFRVEMSAVKDEDYHSANVSGSKDWTDVTITWGGLKQASDWGVDMSLDRTDIRKFSWQVKGDANNSKTLEIDDVTCVGMVSDADKYNSSLDKLVIYPNPSNGTFSVLVPEKCEVNIYDLMGNVVKTFIAIPDFENKVSLSVKGVYVIKAGGMVGKIVVK